MIRLQRLSGFPVSCLASAVKQFCTRTELSESHFSTRQKFLLNILTKSPQRANAFDLAQFAFICSRINDSATFHQVQRTWFKFCIKKLPELKSVHLSKIIYSLRTMQSSQLDENYERFLNALESHISSSTVKMGAKERKLLESYYQVHFVDVLLLHAKLRRKPSQKFLREYFVVASNKLPHMLAKPFSQLLYAMSTLQISRDELGPDLWDRYWELWFDSALKHLEIDNFSPHGLTSVLVYLEKSKFDVKSYRKDFVSRWMEVSYAKILKLNEVDLAKCLLALVKVYQRSPRVAPEEKVIQWISKCLLNFNLPDLLVDMPIGRVYELLRDLIVALSITYDHLISHRVSPVVSALELQPGGLGKFKEELLTKMELCLPLVDQKLIQTGKADGEALAASIRVAAVVERSAIPEGFLRRWFAQVHGRDLSPEAWTQVVFALTQLRLRYDSVPEFRLDPLALRKALASNNLDNHRRVHLFYSQLKIGLVPNVKDLLSCLESLNLADCLTLVEGLTGLILFNPEVEMADFQKRLCDRLRCLSDLTLRQEHFGTLLRYRYCGGLLPLWIVQELDKQTSLGSHGTPESHPSLSEICQIFEANRELRKDYSMKRNVYLPELDLWIDLILVSRFESSHKVAVVFPRLEDYQCDVEGRVSSGLSWEARLKEAFLLKKNYEVRMLPPDLDTSSEEQLRVYVASEFSSPEKMRILK